MIIRGLEDDLTNPVDYLIFDRTSSGTTLVDMYTTKDTFTATLVGVTASGDLNYKVVGNRVSIWCEASIIGTSTSTGLSFTGLPTALRPGWYRRPTCIVEDNTVLASAYCQFDPSDSTVAFAMLSSDVYSTTGFTNSGSKGIPVGWTVEYEL